MTSEPADPAAAPDPVFPSSPAGNAAAAWLRAVNDGTREETLDFYLTRYSKALLAHGSAQQRRDTVHAMRASDGRRHLRAIEHASETLVVAILESERTGKRHRLTIEVEPTPPHAIVKSTAVPLRDGDRPLAEWLGAAEESLSALWGPRVSCTLADTLRGEGRNRVFRLAVKGGPVASVILKATLGEEQKPYVPGDDSPCSAFRSFCNEWAGCAMLSSVGLGPTAYTGDRERGFFLMEDLGAGESLADRLLGDDPAAATAALLAYARTLGELHSRTRGEEARWQELRRERAGTEFRDVDADPSASGVTEFAAVCERRGLASPTGIHVELGRVRTVIDDPGSYRAFTPTDCCPDNHYLRGERVIFFDCEGATTRHALLDAAYLIAPFPTCWCTSRLPDGLSDRLLSTYRRYAPGEEDFEEQLTLAAAAWALPPLTWTLGQHWEEEDRPSGLASLRQRLLHQLENLLARPNVTSVLPHLATLAAELHEMLEARWTSVEPMPLYPAFRGGT